MGRNRGLIRLYAERRIGRLLGAAMIGPRVGHLAHRIAWSVGQGHTVQRMLCLPCASSVIEEALHDALRQAFRRLRVGGSLQTQAAYREGGLRKSNRQGHDDTTNLGFFAAWCLCGEGLDFGISRWRYL